MKQHCPRPPKGVQYQHSYRYRLRFGGPIWLPKLPSIFPRVFENFQATDRSISHARRYRFPKIATGNRTILVSLSMFCAGPRWYICCRLFNSVEEVFGRWGYGILHTAAGRGQGVG